MIHYELIKDLIWKQENFLMFDHRSKLWKFLDSSTLLTLIEERVRSLCYQAMSNFPRVNLSNLLSLDRINFTRILQEVSSILTSESHNKFNTNRDVIPLLEGKAFDLKTKQVRDLTKDDYFTATWGAKYDPIVKSEVLTTFLNQIMSENQNKLLILKERLYEIFFSHTSQKLFFCGNGYNGKDTLIRLIKKTLNIWISLLAFEQNSRFILHPGIDPYVRLLVISGIPKKSSINAEAFNNIFVTRERISTRSDIVIGSEIIRKGFHVIEFNSKFTHDPQEEFEYLIDDHIDEKLDTVEVRTAFFNWLLS
jgi:hypothetical protein